MKQKEAIISSIVRSVMFFTTARHARNLEIAYITRDQHLTIDLQADGSAKVSDQISYIAYHNQSFHHTLHLLDYDVSHLSVNFLDKETHTKRPLLLSDTKEPFTYQVRQLGDEAQRLKLYYHSQHETITFIFDYIIDNFVTNYAELAELIPLRTYASLIQEDADFTGRILLPAGPTENKQGDLTQDKVAQIATQLPEDSLLPEVSAQLINTGPQAQVVVENVGDRQLVHVAVPSEAMTPETTVRIHVDAKLFPENPNAFPEMTLEHMQPLD